MNRKKISVGITGQSGFVGTHLFNTLGLQPDVYKRVHFEDSYFNDPFTLDEFVKNCDVVVHLAAVNRHIDQQVLHDTNVKLVQDLIDSFERMNKQPYVFFSSSIQEKLDNPYGKSKQEGRILLEKWAEKNHAHFTAMVIPNVFGPFCRPNYNSFISTFAFKLIHGENPQIINDSSVPLIFVSSLCQFIVDKINNVSTRKEFIEQVMIPYDFESKVSDILKKFALFNEQYVQKGIIPVLNNQNDINLFNTFRSYIQHDTHFPVLLKMNTDERGTFVETIRLGVGGQVSFSTTKPSITRGDHYHTRKIERFTVIRGKAKIQLRKIGTDEIINLYLDGENPAYVDMPVWYTHNIQNIGNEDLYTQFWINEWYDESNPDTFFEKV